MIDRKNNRADHIENKRGKLCIYDIVHWLCYKYVYDDFNWVELIKWWNVK
jgi:hypothetical protein